MLCVPIARSSTSLLVCSARHALTGSAFNSAIALAYYRSRHSIASIDAEHANALNHKTLPTATKLGERAQIQNPKGFSIESTHFRDELLTAPIPVQDDNTNITGDWVLFHPVYTPEENSSVKVLTRPPRTISDKTAVSISKLVRWGFDLVSRYKHKEIPKDSTMSLEELRAQGYIMSESQWLSRILFLETIAGVPGMVAAALRHLRSLRTMKRDNAWIHTLLEEAENERMHLMTFMTIKQPSVFFRALILGAQGVFWNIFFLSYLVSPSTCHRFVGCLEEEAVITYTRLIKDIEAGRLPSWQNMPAPHIAREYWRLSADAKFLDVIYAIRSDESTHRFVNHSLASLKPQDVNPFAMGEPPLSVRGTKICLERDESLEFVRQSQQKLVATKVPTK